MFSWAGSPDPFALRDNNEFGNTYKQTLGIVQRSYVINPALKNLIAITRGQSLYANVVPSAYAPVNTAAIDQFNIFDGGLYSITGRMLGATQWLDNQGSVLPRLFDKFIPIFDHIIVVDLNIGSTTTDDWVNGRYSDRLPVVMRRLAARGIVPTTPGITWTNLIALGEQDFTNGTSQAAMTAGLNGMIAQSAALGIPGRTFLALESSRGQTSNAIRNAQSAVINGTTVFSLGDYDSAPITSYDGAHPDDAGAAAMATMSYNAMHASGSPF